MIVQVCHLHEIWCLLARRSTKAQTNVRPRKFTKSFTGFSISLTLSPPLSLSLLCARTREHTVGTGDADARLKTDFSSNFSRSRAGLNAFATRRHDYNNPP